jgi:small subunit ribosomal protein S29
MITKRHHDTGLFLQEESAKLFLEQFCAANEKLLKEFKVNLNLWGKYNISGLHDHDPEAVPNLYDPLRKYYFRDHEQFLTKEEVES